MELKRFKEKNRKKSAVIIFSVVYFLFIFNISFVWFCKKKNFDLIRDNEEDQRDLYFAYYVDDEITYNMPSKDSGYTLSDKSVCTNGITISWDDFNWTAKVNYTNYNQEEHSRTKCNLYFEKLTFAKAVVMCGQRGNDATECFKGNNRLNEKELVFDETPDNNLRYIGANPNNYIDIGDRDSSGNIIPWRIIGVMNNVGDGNGNNETRLKIIRNEGIGNYSWDTSISTINNGYGVNEWSEADLMKLLNPGYEEETINGSLYWNSQKGNCYNEANLTSDTCDFTSSGLSTVAKNSIGNAVFHLGSNESTWQWNTIPPTKFYEFEKSQNTGKTCTSGIWCTDTVLRTTSWTGLVGLIYPSDYGHATSGGNNTSREGCLNIPLGSWYSPDNNDCINNNWLLPETSWQWTITPIAHYNNTNFLYTVNFDGLFSVGHAGHPGYVRPVVYLNPSIQIIDGDGTIENIFKTKLDVDKQ